MDALFKISKINVYGILIEGLERDSNEYLSETPPILPSVRNYTYSQSVTVNTLSSVTSDGEETFKTYSVVDHTITTVDSTEFTLEKDGLYIVSHIILPSQLWLNDVLSKDAASLDKYNLIYYYNLETQKFYRYAAGISTEVEFSTIFATDATPPTDVNALTNTIIRADKNTFIMCYLNECFNNICKNLLKLLPHSCNKEKLADDVYKRDILWMAINTIKYCLDTSQLYEAQRFLEEITWCDSLCSSSTNLSNLSHGCGCNN